MSQRIARLLDEPERQVSSLIAKLEAKNGYPSHDARLIAESLQRIRSKLIDLKLDPDDTTAKELYHALQVRFERDSRLFDEYFAADKYDFVQKSAKAIKLLEPYAQQTRQWGLKNKSAKDIIRNLPPKRLMKAWNYRSVESLLKRENLADIFLASGYSESDNWLKNHKRMVAKLDQTAFEIRHIALVNLGSEKWEDIDGPDALVAHNEEFASLGVWPSPICQQAPLLSLVLMLAESLKSYMDLNPTRTIAHLNGIVAWWADMDHLVGELHGEPVSLCLSDCAKDHLLGSGFENRSLRAGRTAFWHELVSRYENLPEIDGLFDSSVRQKIAALKIVAPEPAYEFAEDF